MTTKQELAIVRELDRISRDADERVLAYRQSKWVFRIAGWLLAFISITLLYQSDFPPIGSAFIAILGGTLSGLSILYSSAEMQVPLFKRYAVFSDEAIQARLRELEGK